MDIAARIAKALLTLLALSLLATSAGCGGSAGETLAADEDGIQGTITVSGAWALYPLMVRWGEEFTKLHPDVRFDISAGGAGKGMADALADAVDIGMVSRTIYPEEVARGAFWVSVTKDAVLATASAQNPVKDDLLRQGLSREMLRAIYITGEITTWGQAVGRPEVTDPIHVFTRSDACGAADTWAAYLSAQQEDLLGIGVYGDPGLLDAVVKDPLGIGFNNLNYAFDSETGMPVAGAWVVPLDSDASGRADPEEVHSTKEGAVYSIAMGWYPSPPARDLNLVTHGAPEGLVKAFIIWVLSDGQGFVAEAGYISLPQEQLSKELEKLP